MSVFCCIQKLPALVRIFVFGYITKGYIDRNFYMSAIYVIRLLTGVKIAHKIRFCIRRGSPNEHTY